MDEDAASVAVGGVEDFVFQIQVPYSGWMRCLVPRVQRRTGCPAQSRANSLLVTHSSPTRACTAVSSGVEAAWNRREATAREASSFQ